MSRTEMNLDQAQREHTKLQSLRNARPRRRVINPDAQSVIDLSVGRVLVIAPCPSEHKERVNRMGFTCGVSASLGQLARSNGFTLKMWHDKDGALCVWKVV